MSKLSMLVSLLASVSLFACYGPTTETKTQAQTAPKGKQVKYVTEEGEELHCHYESPTGSHLTYKVCRTRADEEDSRATAERTLHSAPLPPVGLPNDSGGN